MLSIHGLKRRAILSVTAIVVTLAAALMAQPASAQIKTIADAQSYFRHRTFHIDPTAAGQPFYVLQIVTLENNGTFSGNYYPLKATPPATPPSPPNVGGTITISPGLRGGIATSISFLVGASTGGGVLSGGTQFEGAIRFGSWPFDTTTRSFMAGTFSILSPDGSLGYTGPFPFSARSNR